MRIDRIRITPFRLPLQRVLTTAQGDLAERAGFSVRIDAHNGLSGCGEAAPLPAFGTESARQCARALATLAEDTIGSILVESPLAGVDHRLDRHDRLAAATPTARAAFDLALHDLVARSEGLSVAALLLRRGGGSLASAVSRQPQSVVVNALIGGEDEAALGAAAQRAVAEGYRVLKLKLGARPLVDDLARIDLVAQHLPAQVALRLDVNGGWREMQARQALDALVGQPVECLEQPLPAADLAGMARLRALGIWVLAADEAVSDPAALERVVATGAADRVVLKPAALGGLRPAWRMAARARAAGLQVVVTSLLDSSIGVHGAWQLAAALPGPLPACGLATGGLLRADLAAPLRPAGGRLAAPVAPGLGVAVDQDALRRRSCGTTETYVAPGRP